MYTDKQMERQLRKGDLGEALFREWAERALGGLFTERGWSLEQQGFNPGGFVDRSDKEDLKENSDPDFALYSSDVEQPITGISINSQKKWYSAASTMGGFCIKCPRAWDCIDGNEENLWYNKYNITNDYPQFKDRFDNVDVMLLTLRVNLDSVSKWAKEENYEKVVHGYIFGGIEQVVGKDREQFLHYLRHGRRSENWWRSMEIRWILHSELEELDEEYKVGASKIPYWTTGGRSQFGRPREVCCVDVNLSRGEKELLYFLKHEL